MLLFVPEDPLVPGLLGLASRGWHVSGRPGAGAEGGGKIGQGHGGVTTPVAGTGHAVYGFIVDGVWAQRNGLAYSVQLQHVRMSCKLD